MASHTVASAKRFVESSQLSEEAKKSLAERLERGESPDKIVQEVQRRGSGPAFQHKVQAIPNRK